MSPSAMLLPLEYYGPNSSAGRSGCIDIDIAGSPPAFLPGKAGAANAGKAGPLDVYGAGPG